MVDRCLSLRHVRCHCVECAGGSAKGVTWCPCAACSLWPFRHGVQPATFRARYGDRLLTPDLMPPDTIDLDLLPMNLEKAASAEIDVPGYRQPAVELPERPELSAEEKATVRARFEAGRRKARQANEPLAAEGVDLAERK